jgi:hypothetical protein
MIYLPCAWSTQRCARSDYFGEVEEKMEANWISIRAHFRALARWDSARDEQRKAIKEAVINKKGRR